MIGPIIVRKGEIDYDYAELKERKNDFDYLSYHAEFRDDPMLFYRLGRYYLEKTDDMENAEWWLRMAADRGIEIAAYLVYKAYRDGKFTERPSDKLRYLRMAVDKKFGYAEYEYAKYLMDRSPEEAKEYFKKAASHGNFQAEYTYGKMLYDEGKREEAREWFECSARTDAWTQTRVGLLLYYEYEDQRQAKHSFPLPPSRATSLRMRRYVLLSKGLTHVLSSAYAIYFITQATFSTSDARICTAKSIRSTTTASIRSNAVKTKPRGKESLCINLARKEL